MNPWPLVLETTVLPTELFSLFNEIIMKKYIKELQNRIVLLIICWVTTFLVIYNYKEIFLFLILKPTQLKTNLILNNLIFTNVVELFSTYLELTIFITNQIAVVYFCFNLLAFFAPGLFEHEFKLFKSFFQLMCLFFVVSWICLNNYLAPFMWDFFLSFQESLILQQIHIKFEAKISEYLIFFKKVYYGCNLQYQIFAVLILLITYLDNIKKFVKQFRKIFYLTFLLIATLITPPDVVSQLLVYFSLILFFEFIVLVQIFFKHEV